MRLLVVMAGVVVGISGCFGAPLVHRAPPGNETAGDSGDDAPPWTLDGTSDKIAIGEEKKSAADGKKSPDDKDGDDGGDGDGNETNSTQPPPEVQDDGPLPFDPHSGGSPEELIDDADDDLPTQGTPDGSTDEVLEEVDDATTSPDPVDDAVEDTENTVEKQTGQEIPNTESLLFGS